MKSHKASCSKSSGLTLVEVLIAMVIICVCAVSFLLFQKTSWSQATKTNRYLLAGQVIQKQIEKKRMWIASDALTNYNLFKGYGTVTDVDSTTTPRITIKYNIYDTLHAPDGTAVKNACQVDVLASWGTSDTLKVTTCFARDF